MKHHLKFFGILAVLALFLAAAAPASAGSPTDFGQQGSLGYAIQQQGKTNRLVSFATANPALARVIGSVPTVVGAEFVDHDYATLYVLATHNTLYAVDTASAKYVAVGKAEPLAGHAWSGMAWDPHMKVLFAVSVPVDGSRDTPSMLYMLDAASGSSKPVAKISGGGEIAAIAVDPVSGTLFGIDATTDAFVAIDAATGNASEIGRLGIDAGVRGQGLDFDDRSGALYYSATLADSTREGQLYTIDLKSGSIKLLTGFGSNVFRDGFAIAAQ